MIHCPFWEICPETSGLSELVEFSTAGPNPAAVFKGLAAVFERPTSQLFPDTTSTQRKIVPATVSLGCLNPLPRYSDEIQFPGVGPIIPKYYLGSYVALCPSPSRPHQIQRDQRSSATPSPGQTHTLRSFPAPSRFRALTATLPTHHYTRSITPHKRAFPSAPQPFPHSPVSQTVLYTAEPPPQSSLECWPSALWSPN